MRLMRSSTGFTMVELVLVLAVFGVLIAVAAPKFWNQDAYDVGFSLDELTAALRYGQKVAIHTNCAVQFNLVAGPPVQYNLRQQAPAGGTCNQAGAFTQAVIDPADVGVAYAGTLPNGVGVTLTDDDPRGINSLMYDRQGRIFSGGVDLAPLVPDAVTLQVQKNANTRTAAATNGTIGLFR